ARRRLAPLRSTLRQVWQDFARVKGYQPSARRGLRTLSGLSLDVEMAKAGDHVLTAYQSEQQRPVIVAEVVDALVSSASVLFGSADRVEGLCANRGIVQRADEFEVPTIGGGNEPAQVTEAVDGFLRGASLKAVEPSRCSTLRWCLKKETSLVVVVSMRKTR